MKIDVNGTMMQAKILFSENDIHKRIKELSEKINADHGKDNVLVILIVLNGALIFAADLIRNLIMPTEMETIRLKSYESMSSTGHVQLLTQLPDLAGKHVLVVEDIIDTGRSLHFLLENLKHANTASVKVCSLLNKPEAREFDVTADYVGFDIAKNFVVGYGLDLDGRLRNLPYVADLLPQAN